MHQTPVRAHFQLRLMPINDAPVLSTSGSSVLSGSGNTFTTTNFTTILEDNTTSNGNAVSSFLNADSAEDVGAPQWRYREWQLRLLIIRMVLGSTR